MLYLLVDDAPEARRNTAHRSISLPPFVRHLLQAKCRELNFHYIVTLLKDLLRISQPRWAGLGGCRRVGVVGWVEVRGCGWVGGGEWLEQGEWVCLGGWR